VSKPATASRGAIQVRDATSGDLEEIVAIYAHHVRHGLASFEETPPGLEEMERRFQALAIRDLPYLVAEQDGGGIQGYAYAGPYRARPGYRYSIENSVYVAPGAAGKGLGKALLEELIRRCTDLGYRQMIAIIGDSKNWPSIRLHESFGFRHVGTLSAVGFKFGRWIDSVILQRPLGDGESNLPEQSPAD
jgi:L-amino acid N-acyltransferase YncA